MKEQEIIRKYLSDRGRHAAEARWANATDEQRLLVGKNLKRARAKKAKEKAQLSGN